MLYYLFFILLFRQPITKKSCQSRLEVRLRAAQGLDCDNKVKELMRMQYSQMEDEINKLKLAKYGRATNVHKMKEKVTGSKKAQQEPHAIFDAETEKLVISNDKIKEVTLKHCLNALKDNTPGEEVKQIVDLVNKVHDNRMKEEDIDEVKVSMEDFEEVLDKIERKHKRSYDFITKSGNGFKSSMFKLCSRLIQKEEETSKRKLEQPPLHSYEGLAAKIVRMSSSK